MGRNIPGFSEGKDEICLLTECKFNPTYFHVLTVNLKL